MARTRKYVRPILRLTAFVAVSCAVLLYLDYRAAHATVMEHLLGLGQRMAPYLDDGRSTEAPRQFRVNGVRMFAAAGHTEQPPEFVRKWYQDRYAAKGDGLDELGLKLKARGVLPPSAPGLNQMAFGNDKQGGVAALDFGDKLSLAALKDRMFRFIDAGDLGSIARLRYVWYEKTGKGGTRFLTIWTDDHFKLGDVLPTAKKDAVGNDLEGVPRFPGSIRVLSSEERGMPQRMVVYDGPGSPETGELFYRARMKTLGWYEDETFANLAKKQGKHSLRFQNKAGHEVVIDLAPSTDERDLTVACIQTR